MSEPWQAVVDFWFGDAATDPAALEKRDALWWGTDADQRDAVDERIRREFGHDIERALRGELDEWAQNARGRLALILVLDQFTRNVFRGSEQAFGGDARALDLVVTGMKAGADLLLRPVERYFFYMPLQHAEDASAQQRGVDAFGRLAHDAPDLHAMTNAGVRYAEMHRDIVLRFGRFPHRNALLGRASTPAEREYLARDAPDFGQSAKQRTSDASHASQPRKR